MYSTISPKEAEAEAPPPSERRAPGSASFPGPIAFVLGREAPGPSFFRVRTHTPSRTSCSLPRAPQIDCCRCPVADSCTRFPPCPAQALTAASSLARDRAARPISRRSRRCVGVLNRGGVARAAADTGWVCLASSCPVGGSGAQSWGRPGTGCGRTAGSLRIGGWAGCGDGTRSSSSLVA
jgi:hypothetical protein